MRIFPFLSHKIGDLTLKYSNLPESYIKRAMEQVYYRTPVGYPQYLQREIKRKRFRFTTNRPWTFQSYEQNAPGLHRKKIFLEPVGEWSIFVGDRVEILVGRDKGKQGIVNQVIQERNWVFVDGLNTHFRIIGKDKNFPGIVIRSEAPLLVTNEVKLIDPETLKNTEIEWRYTEDGQKVRVSKASGRIIPIPKQAMVTMDYKNKSAYLENEVKDTKADDVTKITFKPQLKTFEMEVMEEMGIKEDRVPAPTFWY